MIFQTNIKKIYVNIYLCGKMYIFNPNNYVQQFNLILVGGRSGILLLLLLGW